MNWIGTCAWVLIYGGMLGATVAWFVRAQSQAIGSTLMVASGVAAAVGVVLILVRSRMGP